MSMQPLTIIVADDDDGDRKQVKRALKQAGIACKVAEAADICEAIAACEKQSFDCAILDYQMPGRSGLEGIELLHKKLPHMAIIMATGHGDELVAAEAFKCGATDYIPKHLIDAESLKRVLTNALDKVRLQRKVDDQREALENFASVLAHDLKAPLTRIRGANGLIPHAIKNDDTNLLLKNHEQVEKACLHMALLIDTLAEYNQLAHQQVVFELTSLEAALDESLNNLDAIIKAGGASVGHDKLPEVMANKVQIVQLLQNLIANALKYCQADVPSVHISAREVDDSWCISIKDNGIGISQDSLISIFEPFRRLHAPGKYSGTGLGLATCQKIVERHSGKIWCESEEGKGTVFYFTIPGKEKEKKETRT